MPLHRPAPGSSGNLLPNPDFELAQPGDPLTPAGWVTDASHASTVARTGRSPRSGRWALDARLAFGPEGQGTVQLVTEHPVPVAGGTTLVIGGTFLREPEIGPANADDPGASVWITGRWLDTRNGASQGRTVGQFMHLPTAPLPVGRFADRRETVTAPHDATALALIYVLVGGDMATGRNAPLVVDSVYARALGRVTRPMASRAATDAAHTRHRGRPPSGHSTGHSALRLRPRFG